MCLIVFAKDAHPDYPLVFAANRDEFYARPTAAAHFWEEAPDVLAGRDERAGGTWMGITERGRWAAVTNVRTPEEIDTPKPAAPSRGALVANYLKGEDELAAYMEGIVPARYNGFNLLAGTPERLLYLSNYGAGGVQEAGAQEVAAGIHGLSNAHLDTPWPKVERMKKRFAASLSESAVEPAALLDLLRDPEPAPDAALPDTGVEQEWERVLSAPFIISPAYGTRASTVLLIHRSGRVTFAERTFGTGGAELSEEQFSFEVEREA